ncbi:AmmeMemoRadiSam system protein B [Geofilum sp. OHC36d9]|uniref:AmmeMemoRadiSam system protein B n=1 Tax=Geofilum sp. OHC36d9 TaxID=3458413 RepID=UPI0040335D88
MKTRKPAFAGTFYDKNRNNLLFHLKQMFINAQPKESQQPVAALIVPHAGYIYSGTVAASAYQQLPAHAQFNRIYLIGSSHRMTFSGAALFDGQAFETPLGDVPVDTAAVQELAETSNLFHINNQPHQQEHTLEVQLPFLQYHLKKPFKIVPVIIGTQDEDDCRLMAQALHSHFHEGNLFIISTDFSHYPNYSDAQNTDHETAGAILKNNPAALHSILKKHRQMNIPNLATSLCSWTSVLTLLCLTQNIPGIQYHHIIYQNSGDSPQGDTGQVVGYEAIKVTRPTQYNFSLTANNKNDLLTIARQTLSNTFNKMPDNITAPASEILNQPAGAFVSLYISGHLNGCIGQLEPSQPLWLVVKEMVLAAAFDDHRFDRLKAEDLPYLEIEISVLTPPAKITDINEIEPGRHGIIIQKGPHRGTFLPQVAQRMHWTREEMLRHCARDKMGIDADGWKDAELFTYEAIVFKDHY